MVTKRDNAAYAKAWRERHPEASRNASRLWKARNPKTLASYPRLLLNSAKRRARDLGVPFDLTEEDIRVPDRCPLLGVPLEAAGLDRRGFCPSIDRIDPKRGYVRGNIWIISYRANAIKSDATADELERIAAGLRVLEASRWPT